jgi:GNAT superfamily N-acetyltransferase
MQTQPATAIEHYDDVMIRPARPSDIAALETVALTALRVLGASYYTPQQIDSLVRYLSPIDRDVIADGGYFVATVEQQIVAGGGWSRRSALYTHQPISLADDAATMLDPASDAARIRAFYVHPAWAGRGIARRLMRLCEQAAQDAGFRRLELLATLTGVPLYLRCGFVGSAQTMLRLPDDTLIPLVRMTKTLSPRDAVFVIEQSIDQS